MLTDVPVPNHTVQNDTVSFGTVHITRYTWGECRYVLDEGLGNGTRLNGR